MNKPTPEEYVIQRAMRWRETQKEVLASRGANKEIAQFAHQEAKRKLSEAVDIATRANQQDCNQAAHQLYISGDL